MLEVQRATTRVLVFEYLSSGAALPGHTDSASLLQAGRAMRNAVVADLAGLPGLAVTAASSAGLDGGLPPNVAVMTPAPGESPAEMLGRGHADHDLVWVVAPETDGLLAGFEALIPAPKWIGCSAPALACASSKSATLKRLHDAGLCTPLAPEFENSAGPWVSKPDDGAGSEHTTKHAHRTQALAAQARMARAGQATVLEPWIDGEAWSLSLLCAEGGCELLAVNRQHIGVDGEGGVSLHGVSRWLIEASVDARWPLLAELAQRVMQALPGLCGFVGVDLVWHPQHGAVVIEVNPRVTSAYVGLSDDLGHSVAARVLAAHRRAFPAAGGREASAAALHQVNPRTHAASTSTFIGWDIGGAHVKACLMHNGLVHDVAEWPCPLWQGLHHLEAALDHGLARWPLPEQVTHAVTMTGEMVDLFPHREDGVMQLATVLAQRLVGNGTARVRFFAGDAGWCSLADVAAHWPQIASANWRATAMHAAQCVRDGVLVDIGSTTTDLIALRQGRVAGTSVSDAHRLASGELVYQGVVRTPLCALAPRITLAGTTYNVMNEFFATTADVYRLSGELNPLHDLHPAADQGDKSAAATRQRLARMVGLDARDATEAQWLTCAQAWRTAQLAEIQSQLERVLAAHALPASAPLISAGCGAFLVRDLAARTGRPVHHYGRDVAPLAADAPADAPEWAQVCAPSVAVAALLCAEEIG